MFIRLLIIALFALPFTELYLIISWLLNAPLSAAVYLVSVTALGIGCIKFAKFGFGELLTKIKDSRATGVPMLLMLAKLWVIGCLLIFPGYLTDIIALCVWLFLSGEVRVVSRRADATDATDATGADVIDAEAHFVDDDKPDKEQPPRVG